MPSGRSRVATAVTAAVLSVFSCGRTDLEGQSAADDALLDASAESGGLASFPGTGGGAGRGAGGGRSGASGVSGRGGGAGRPPRAGTGGASLRTDASTPGSPDGGEDAGEDAGICNGQGETVQDECFPGERHDCYPALATTAGVGVCHAGARRCAPTLKGRKLGPCEGYVVPLAEVAGNRLDDDCDGLTDEPCTPGETAPCHARGVRGSCHPGTAVCKDGAAGRPAFGECEGEVYQPTREEHGNCRDDDCDARIDETASYAAAAVYDAAAGAILVVYQDQDGAAWFVRVNRDGAWLAPPSALAAAQVYAVATTLAAWSPASREMGVAYGQGNELHRVSADGGELAGTVLTDNGCGPSRLEWSGSAFITAYSTTIYDRGPVNLVVATPGAPASVVPLDWLGGGHCNDSVQVTAESPSVFGLLWHDPPPFNRLGPFSIRFATLDPAGKLLGGPFTLAGPGGRYGNPAIAWAKDRYVAVWTDGNVGGAQLVSLDAAGTVGARATLPRLFDHPPRLQAEGGRVTGVAWAGLDLVFFSWEPGRDPTSHVVAHCDTITCNGWTAQMTPVTPGLYAVLFHMGFGELANDEVFLVLDDGSKTLGDPIQISPD